MGLVKVKFNRNVGRKNKFSIMKLNEVKPSGDVKIENKISNRLIRLLFVVMGTIFVGLVYIAVLLPVVPQSPFLLIALVCYSRGSERLENWLINNRLFGKYLKDIRERG
ncbi:MAG TPA: DUF454 domain-containing protein, partial [Methanothermococcus okinawensis]|nr:DUF454 domain-containing protein [Methanothermococcus okinawensis]